MMKPAALVLVTLVVFSCRGPEEQSSLLPDTLEGWKKTTHETLNYPIPGHMDNYREIFINPTGEGVTRATVQGRVSWTYPEGTILAKTIYPGPSPAAATAPVAVTAMMKASGDPRSQGGWIWVMKDLSSGKERVFREEFCLSCHEDANQNHPYGQRNPQGEFRDYVFFPYWPEGSSGEADPATP